MKRHRPTQLPLPGPRTWGGKRRNAGRPRVRKSRVPHRTRQVHKNRHPVHATLRAREGLPSLREPILFGALKTALAGASKPSFRVVHFSVQSNHLHLIVEAHDKAALSRGMQGLAIRLAKAASRALRCRGGIFSGRYHAHELRAPSEVRNALLYVLQNWRKHGHRGDFDPRSSALSFDGWKDASHAPADPTTVVAAPLTWLVTTGWRRRGLIRLDEGPRALTDAPA